MKCFSHKNSIILSIALVYLIAIAVYLELVVPYHICFKEQTSVFICGQGLLWDYFTKPAALSKIAGDFLTQFFAFKHTGTIIIVLVFALLLTAVQKTMQALISEKDNIFTWSAAFLVTGIECALFTGIDWDISMCVGLIAALYTFVLWNRSSTRWLQYILIAIAFPLIGGYILMLAMLFIITLIERKRYIGAIIIALESIIFILVFSRIGMLYPGQAIVYPLEQHSLSADPSRMFISFAVILLFYILSVLPYGYHKTIKRIACPISAVCCIIVFLWTYNKNDEHILELSTHTYHRDWNSAEKASSTKGPDINVYDVLVHNHALARKGELSEKLLEYPQIGIDGMFLPTIQTSTYIDHFFNVDFHLELGDLTWATDCSFLGHTQVRGGMPSRMIRRSAEIAVLAGDSALAEKYLNLLSHSIPHKRWAADVKKGLRSGKLPQELARLDKLTPESDYHFNQNDHSAALISVVEGNRNNGIALDYLLCAYILDKDLTHFVSAFNSYYNYTGPKAIPQIYQEALIASARNMDQLIEFSEKYHLNQSLLSAYMQFSKAIQTGDRKTAGKFSGSYWNYLLMYGK